MFTPEHAYNARRLADVLDKVAEEWPDRFNMQFWVQPYTSGMSPDHDDELIFSEEQHLGGRHPVECGTIACALGWAPYALGEALDPGESWTDYGQRMFGVTTPFSAPDDSCSLPMHWAHRLFSSDGTRGADGARRAAVRLREFADHIEERSTS